ncbi:MAG: DNA primase [Deltaproteobacteria bacterium]|nr:DNA primase [Deltaproteobacteria bacterium]
MAALHEITPDFLQQLKDKVHIVDIISEYVPLRQAGHDFKGLCPFHSEKTPSFVVSSDKQLYHCFGCKAGGDVIAFVQQYEQVSFPEAVALLAGRVGLELPRKGESEGRSSHTRQRDSQGNQRFSRDLLYRINAFAGQYFQKNLHSAEGRKVLDYLVSRGIHPKTIRQFQLGFASPSWDDFLKLCASRRIPLELPACVGLLIEKRSESDQRQKKGADYYDRFRNRVMFPIYDLRRKGVGFGGRTLGSDSAKYLNSPESEIFNKSSLLYGLSDARNGMRDHQCAIVVEGYVDWLMMWQAGFTNVAATMGTALTEEHIKLLKRMIHSVILMFDGDEAGVQAADRSLFLCLSAGLDVKISILPKGSDPASFLVEQSIPAMKSIIEGAEHPIDFRLRHFLEKRDPSLQARLRAVEGVAPLIMSIPEKVERDLHIHKVSEKVGLDEGTVAQYCLQAGREERLHKSPPAEQKRGFNTDVLDRYASSEKLLVQLMLVDEGVRLLVIQEGIVNQFSHEKLGLIGKYIIEKVRENAKVSETESVSLPPNFASRMMSELGGRDLEIASILSEIAIEPLPPGNLQQIARDCLERIRKDSAKETARLLRQRLLDAEREGKDTAEIIDLLKKYQDLVQPALKR